MPVSRKMTITAVARVRAAADARSETRAAPPYLMLYSARTEPPVLATFGTAAATPMATPSPNMNQCL